MKIWFPVIRGGSGTDVFTRRLAGALQRRGIETEITWYHQNYQFAPLLLSRTVPPPDTSIIHANTWSGFAFKRHGIPLVVTEHLGVLDQQYRPYKSPFQHIYHETLIRAYVTRSLETADIVTAVSRYTAASLVNLINSTTERHVVYNSVDVEMFIPCNTTAVRQNEVLRLLFVGNLTRRKGADMLDRIMQKLGAGFELHVTCGLRTAGLKSGSRNIVDIGRISNDRDLAEMYRKHDVLLFPSRHEGFGLVLAEAMACGLPVIAAKNSAIPEVVEDGKTGILCPTDDVDAFINACRRLASNPKLRKRLGEAGRQRVMDLFSEDVVIPQYISLYKSLVGRPA